MNLQDKIALLKKELESKNMAPKADEVWGNIDRKLKARLRKKKLILSSLALIILAICYIAVNNGNPASNEPQIHVDDAVNHQPVREHNPVGLKTDQKNLAIVPLNENKAEIDQHTQRIAVPRIIRHMPGNGPLKTADEKESSASKQGSEDNLSMVLKTRLNMHDGENTVDTDVHASPKNETGLIDMLEKDTRVVTEKNENISVIVEDSVKKDENKIADKNSKADSIQQKTKRYVIRPYLGIVFNQLKPFSVPGKTYAYSLFSNYSAGLLLDYHFNPHTMVSLNLGYIKLPSKIEFLQKDSTSNEEIIKVLNTNNLILGLEFSRFNARKNICYNLGHQVTVSGRKRNFIEQEMNGKVIYNQQKQLPQDFQDKYFSKIDFLFNAGLSFYHDRSILRINYYQGLRDVSRTTVLFNPHAFIQLNYAYQLFRF
jgi:hypothetical protein